MMHSIKTAAKRRSITFLGALLVAALAIPGLAHAAPVRVMIDPGHGGRDSGAVGAYGNAEKNVNLAISQWVVEAAKRQGWDVGVTRDSDRFVPLNARPASAAQWGATDLISIHSNSVGASPRGSMTIHRGGASAGLGQAIMDQMAPLSPGGDIGNRGDVRGLAVLRGAKMPAVIVEVLSMSSYEELVKLTTPEVQQQYAEAIVRGIAAYHGVQYVAPPAPPAPPAPDATPSRRSAEEAQQVRPAKQGGRPARPDVRRAEVGGSWLDDVVRAFTSEQPLLAAPTR